MLDLLFLRVIDLAGQAVGHQHEVIVDHLEDDEIPSLVTALDGKHHPARDHRQPFHHALSSHVKPGSVRISGRPSSLMARVCS